MFSDPLAVTYDSTAVSLPRATGFKPGAKKEIGKTVYKTADGQYALYLTRTAMSDDVTRVEIILERVALDADGPFTGSYQQYPNRMGFVYEVNNLRVNTSTDIALIRTAIDSLVDSTFQSRLISGEL